MVDQQTYDQSRGEVGAIGMVDCMKEAKRMLAGADYYLRGEESAVVSLLMMVKSDPKSGVTKSMVEDAVARARALWDGDISSPSSIAGINHIRQLDVLAREGLLKLGANRSRRKSVMEQYPTTIATPVAG